MTTITRTGIVYLKPTLQVQVYRGCRACHAPHPLAMRPPPVDTDHCPACGEPVTPVEPARDVSAWIMGAGLWPRVARVCVWACDRLAKLIERV